MILKRSFEKDVIYFGASVFIERILGFIMLPFLAAKLNFESFAIWSQIQIIYAFISTIILMGYPYSVSELIHKYRDGNKQKRILNGLLIITLISSILFFIFAFIFKKQISTITFGSSIYAFSILYVGLFIISESLYELVAISFLRSISEIRYSSKNYILRNFLRCLIILATLSFSNSLTPILINLTCLNFIFVIYIKYRKLTPAKRPKKNLLIKLKKELIFIKKLFFSISHSAIFSISVILSWLTSSINRFVIVHTLNLEKLAFYSANYSICSVPSFIPMVINFILLHHLSGAIKRNSLNEAKTIIHKSLILYSIISIPIIFLLFIFYPEIASNIIPKYKVSLILRFSLLFYFFIYGFEQLIIFSIFAYNYKTAVKVRLAGFLTNLVLCYGFIKLGGIEYAAISICLSSATMILLSLHVLNKSLNIKKTIKAIFLIVLRSTLLTSLIMFLKNLCASYILMDSFIIVSIFMLTYYFIVINHIKIFFKGLFESY